MAIFDDVNATSKPNNSNAGDGIAFGKLLFRSTESFVLFLTNRFHLAVSVQ